MVNGWSKVVDDSTQLQYRQDDTDALVVANKQPDGGWRIIARDNLGRNVLGSESSKADARSRMKSYMRRQGAGGGGMGIAGGSGGGMDGGSPLMSADEESDVLEDLDPF